MFTIGLDKWPKFVKKNLYTKPVYRVRENGIFIFGGMYVPNFFPLTFLYFLYLFSNQYVIVIRGNRVFRGIYFSPLHPAQKAYAIFSNFSNLFTLIFL